MNIAKEYGQIRNQKTLLILGNKLTVAGGLLGWGRGIGGWGNW